MRLDYCSTLWYEKPVSKWISEFFNRINKKTRRLRGRKLLVPPTGYSPTEMEWAVLICRIRRYLRTFFPLCIPVWADVRPIAFNLISLIPLQSLCSQSHSIAWVLKCYLSEDKLQVKRSLSWEKQKNFSSHSNQLFQPLALSFSQNEWAGLMIGSASRLPGWSNSLVEIPEKVRLHSKHWSLFHPHAYF